MTPPLDRQDAISVAAVAAAAGPAALLGETVSDRALRDSQLSITISDPSHLDNPLVWVNSAFTRETGYSFDEAVGRNCRFLQGPDSDRAVTDEVREALAKGQPITRIVLNYRKDGSPFWNQVSISPVLDETGRPTHFIGVQADVSDRVNLQHGLDSALMGAEAARERLTILAGFTREIASILDVAGVIRLLSNFVVPRFATWCALYTYDEQLDQLSTPEVLHERAGNPEVDEAVARMRELAPAKLSDTGPIRQVLLGKLPHVLIEQVPSPPEASGTDDELAGLAPVVGLASMIVVPLTARDRVIGAFGIAAGPDRPPYGEDDLAVMLDLAGRTGLMIENATLYTVERDAVATLQRGLLPEIPDLAGISVCVQYVPAMSRATVGGDWYDVFPLADGRVGLAIGDVMGHDFAAAATMGSLRHVLRSYAWSGAAPHEVLTSVDELVDGLSMRQFATCIYGCLARPGDSETHAVFEYANAGHPPPVLMYPDGRAVLLPTEHDVMIGVHDVGADRGPRSTCTVLVPRGAKIVCFTDGLLGGEGAELDVSLEDVRSSVEVLGADATCSQIADHLADKMRQAQRPDDVAVLVVAIH